jgi:hypothetical protein
VPLDLQQFAQETGVPLDLQQFAQETGVQTLIGGANADWKGKTTQGTASKGTVPSGDGLATRTKLPPHLRGQRQSETVQRNHEEGPQRPGARCSTSTRDGERAVRKASRRLLPVIMPKILPQFSSGGRQMRVSRAGSLFTFAQDALSGR